MILGLLTCSRKKLPVPAPAWLLYSASPRFSQQYQSLSTKCDKILILSAKYGPLNLEDVIEPYDKVLLTPTKAWIDRYRKAIEQVGSTSIISYLHGPYLSGVPGDAKVEQLTGDSFERSSKVGVQGKIKRGKQLVCWPMEWILKEVMKSRPTLAELRQALIVKGYAEKTIQAQLYRTRGCPLHQLIGGRIENKYTKLVRLPPPML